MAAAPSVSIWSVSPDTVASLGPSATTGVPVDKMNHMVGSYAPKTEVQSYTTPVEDAPGGITGRGTYHVYSLFTDDDKKEYLKWEWYINIKKDW